MTSAFITSGLPTLQQIRFIIIRISWLELPCQFHRLGDLSNRNILSLNSGDWNSEIKVSAGLFLLRPLSPWFTGGCLLPMSSHCFPFVPVCVLISSHIVLGPTYPYDLIIP